MGKHEFDEPYAAIRDPLDDLVLSHLLDAGTALNLSRAERVVILAAVRSEVLINPHIREQLRTKVGEVARELSSARRSFPQASSERRR